MDIRLPNPLTLEDCHAKVAECRDMAARAQSPHHRTILLHMAETWARICADLTNQADGHKEPIVTL